MKSRASRFSTANHIRSVKGESRDGKKHWDADNESELQGIVSDQGAFEKRFSLCAIHTGAWTSIRGITVNNTVLSAT